MHNALELPALTLNSGAFETGKNEIEIPSDPVRLNEARKFHTGNRGGRREPDRGEHDAKASGRPRPLLKVAQPR